MAGFDNYAKGKGPPPTGGVFKIESDIPLKTAPVFGPRPQVKFSSELATKICDELAKGVSLSRVVNSEGMPSWHTLVKWRVECPDFDREVELSLQAGDEVVADEIQKIADTPLIGEKIKTLPDGSQEIQTGDNVARSNLMIESRKFLLGKRSKRYSDKMRHEVTGENGGPLQLIVERIEVIGKPDQD